MIINPTNRDDIRERAIETTSEIVLKCGNLSVRMDDVAQELSVSKRTLYEIFGSKEELLVECMKRHIARMSKIIADEMGREEDVLTVFIKHLEVLIAESRERDHNKFEDMDKYPKLKKLFHEHLADMACRMRGFMELGVRQGVFRDDLNMDVLMKSFSAMGTMANKESESGQFRYDELIDGTIVVLLRGIATPKGMEKLDKYRYKSNNR
ncbi:MAG: TetR/AcrR family transcriptional regulator [Bacteroidaceae bacterium]|jgi:AcrR family transcriptional regulator|nr:TetR/AcrR family transcriptional regulator [Bacteroidaceae bacterium]